MAQLSKAFASMPSGRLKDAIRLAIQTADGDLAKVRKFLEDWFDATMDRVSGGYKRRTQILLFAASLAGCVALNVNTVLITQALFADSTLRQGVIVQAEAANIALPRAADALADLENSGLPIGWTAANQTEIRQRISAKGVEGLYGYLEIFAGWAMTAFAITLGAPFWFDVLNKIMVIRSTVKPAEKSGKEASKDPAAVRSAVGPAAATATQVAEQPRQPDAPTPAMAADRGEG
jgi:hypothetical protein